MDKRHPLILAIDEQTAKTRALIEEACSAVSGVKIGLPLLVEKGVETLASLRKLCDETLWILDLKLADIGAVMVKVVEKTGRHVDAVIAHSFVGVAGALSELKKWLNNNGLKLILVATMSHPGAMEVYDRILPLVARIVDTIDPWGLVAPATRPSMIRWLRSRYPQKKILSPGIGAQGAKPGSALCSGADYEIVGRAIIGALDAVAALQSIVKLQVEAMKKCGKSAS